MATSPSKQTPLREELRAAVSTRKLTLSMGWSRRKDLDRLRAAVGRAEVFLGSYPFASDERVREYCIKHREDVSMIVIGHHQRRLQQLLMDELKPAGEAPPCARDWKGREAGPQDRSDSEALQSAVPAGEAPKQPEPELQQG
jgi:hypothetical protein